MTDEDEESAEFRRLLIGVAVIAAVVYLLRWLGVLHY